MYSDCSNSFQIFLKHAKTWLSQFFVRKSSVWVHSTHSFTQRICFRVSIHNCIIAKKAFGTSATARPFLYIYLLKRSDIWAQIKFITHKLKIYKIVDMESSTTRKINVSRVSFTASFVFILKEELTFRIFKILMFGGLAKQSLFDWRLDKSFFAEINWNSKLQ